MNFTLFFTEIQHHYFNDINLSQDILTNFTNSPPIVNNIIENNAITQTSPKHIQAQSLPFFDPSFFAPVLSTVYKWLKQKQRPHSLTPVIKANSFRIHIIDNSNIYILTQILILSNNIRLTLEFLKKSFSKLNPLLTKHLYVYHLNFFMLHLVKHILMVILVKNSLLRHLINFILSLICLYGSHFSSMTALNVKLINIFLFNPKTFLLLFLFMRVLLTSTTGSPWTLKAQFLHLLKTSPRFLSSLTHSVILLLLTQLLTLLLNMQSKLFSIIGSQKLVPLNTLLHIEVPNISIKIWLIYVLFFILITHLELPTLPGQTV